MKTPEQKVKEEHISGGDLEARRSIYLSNHGNLGQGGQMLRLVSALGVLVLCAQRAPYTISSV